MEISSSVSYTHLDVYKRQQQKKTTWFTEEKYNTIMEMFLQMKEKFDKNKEKMMEKLDEHREEMKEIMDKGLRRMSKTLDSGLKKPNETLDRDSKGVEEPVITKTEDTMLSVSSDHRYFVQFKLVCIHFKATDILRDWCHPT